MSPSATDPDETTLDVDDLLERQDERALLLGAIEQATGGVGSALIIEGPPGIGKTRLLQEALRAATSGGLHCLVARGSELERAFAFGVARQLFELEVTKSSEQLMGGAAGLAAPLFPDLAAGSGAMSEDPHAVMHGLYWLTVNLAREDPLVLAVDDAHWADAPSLRWLLYLINRIEEIPVVLLVATRAHDPGAAESLLASMASHPVSKVMVPDALSAEAVSQIAAQAFGMEPDPSFLSACVEVTRGNPFFVQSIVRTLARERIAPDAGAVGQLGEIATTSVARTVGQWLARLPDDALRLIDALAVLDEAPDRQTVARVAGLDPSAAAAAVDASAKAELVRDDGRAFTHPLVRSVAYSEMPGAVRNTMHATAARLLHEQGAEHEQVALHVLASDGASDPWSVEVLSEAARLATSRGAPEVAITYLRRALVEPPATDARAELLYRLGLAEVAAQGMVGTDHLQQAVDQEDDRKRKADMSLRLGTILFTQGQFGRSAAVLEAGLAFLTGSDEEPAPRMEAQLMSIALLDLATLSRLNGLQGIAERIGDRAGDPRFLATLAWIRVATEVPADVGADLAERALSDAGLAIEEDAMVFAGATTALMAAGRFEQAKAVWDQAVEVARGRSSISALNFALVLRAAVLLRLGEVAATEADMREIIERALELPILSDEWRVSMPWVLAPLIDSLLERGQIEEAARWIGMSGIEGELPQLLQFTYLLDSIGRLRIAQLRTQEGVAHLRECGARLQAWGIENPGFVPWRSHLALALATLGEHEEATQLCDQEIEVSRAFGVSREIGMALRAKGLVIGGDDGTVLLQEAVATLDTSPARLEYVRALTDLGAALRRRGHRADAREPLRLGLDGASRCGATALMERAHAELVAAGARPRRALLSGVRALTASELRVCKMAATGLNNRQIAEALFVTEKTVEGHLGNAYRKLDLSSRTDLPRVLDETAMGE